MSNLGAVVLEKLYTDTDGFTKDDCVRWLQISSAPTLGSEQRWRALEQCEAATAYVREADAGRPSSTAWKRVTSSALPKGAQMSLLAVDWRRALSKRLPFLRERLEDRDICGSSLIGECIPAIEDVAKLGRAGRSALPALERNAASFYGEQRAHALAAIERVAPSQRGRVARRIRELARMLKNGEDQNHESDLATEAAAYASFRRYAGLVREAFVPLLADEGTFRRAVWALSGAGAGAKDLVPQMLAFASGFAAGKRIMRGCYADGMNFSDGIERIVGVAAPEVKKAAALSSDGDCHWW